MDCHCKDGRSHFYEHKEVVAKKNHQCIECKNSIPIGTKYIYHKGVWEDDCGKNFWSAKVCAQCSKDWDELTEFEFEDPNQLKLF